IGSRDQDTDEFPTMPEPDTRPAAGSSSLVTRELAALTDPGKMRSNNEDHYFAGRFQRSMRTLSTNMPRGAMPETYDETVYAMLVADGVGGSAAGEIASQTAIQALVGRILETPDWILLLAAQVAARALRGRGTTVPAPAPAGHELLTAHVGDSRAYVYRKNGLEPLTRDQTMA